MKFVNTDGGKSSAGFTHEKNDCAVRAHVLFTNTPYAESHNMFKQLGRKDGRGTKNTLIAKLLDPNYSKSFDRMTLTQLRNKYPRGRIYALKRGHAFALIDGVLHDTWAVGGKSRVFCYWMDNEAKEHAVTAQADAPRAAREKNAAKPSDKKQQARAIYDRLNDGSRTKYAIAKEIASEMGITIANANYYCLRCF